MAVVVVDAGIAIAHLDPDDAHHLAASGALHDHAGDDLVLPASAYAETLVVPARAGRLPVARRQLRRLLLRVEPVTVSIAERAAGLRAARRTLRLPDALVLATADELGATAVLTTDARWSGLPHVRLVR